MLRLKIVSLACCVTGVFFVSPLCSQVQDDRGWSSNGFGGASSWNQSLQQALPSIPSSTLADQWQGWNLGARVRHTNTGVVIEEVFPQSAAANAGFEPGDTIVTVNGYQVGIVGNRTFDILAEMRAQATKTDGVVTLLVFQSFNKRLELVNVNLNATSSDVEGVVRLPAGTRLEGNSVLRIELVNDSRPYQEVAGGRLEKSVFGPGPFQFELHYDPRYISPNDRYSVIAYVNNGNQVLSDRKEIVPDGRQGSQRVDLDLRSQTAGQSSSSAYPPRMSRPEDLVNDVFLRYMSRAPNAIELAGWSAELQKGMTESMMVSQILASSQFYNEANRSDRRFIERLFETVTGRPPSDAEFTRWFNRLQELQSYRSPLVAEFLASR